MHDVYHMNPPHLLDFPSELASEFASHDSSLSAYDTYFESLSSVYSFSNFCGSDVSCVNSLEIDSMLSISQDFSFPSDFDSLSKFTHDITVGKEPLVGFAGDMIRANSSDSESRPKFSDVTTINPISPGDLSVPFWS